MYDLLLELCQNNCFISKQEQCLRDFAWCRCVDQLIETLQQLGLHILAVPLCHVNHLLAGAILHSPAVASASQLKLAALAEALVLPDVAAKAEKQAGPFLLSAAESDGNEKVSGVFHIETLPKTAVVCYSSSSCSTLICSLLVYVKHPYTL